jgi:hypothetical protein
VATFADGEGKITSSTYYTTGVKKGLLWKRTVDSDTGGLALVTELDYEDWGSLKSVKDPNGGTPSYSSCINDARGDPT